MKEGSWTGGIVMIGFPEIADARAWWESSAYRAIAPLRSRHIDGNIILVDGVPEGYDPAPVAQAIREAAGG